MPTLNTFKQVLNFLLFGEARNKTSFAIVAACSVAFTVVFNSLEGQCQQTSDPTSSIDGKSSEGADNKTSGTTAASSTITKESSAQGTAETDAAPATSKKVVKASDDKMSTARPKEVQPLPNFHKVTDYLYRGGEPNPAGMHELKKMGVKTVIDLRAQTEAAHDEAALAKKLGIKYINMTMTSEAPTKKQVETLLATIDSAKEKNEPVLVHCAHGSDRTGCMIGIWRVARDNWAFDDTYKEMRKYYFGPKYLKLRNAVKERSTH
ncbi:MAG: dual specificity protein phosphatase family protein [Candidatus Melainabacteria bacterium]|nr:dual specificity protein phosphatase family protein [Candidatus Melainabacteria bacterium]